MAGHIPPYLAPGMACGYEVPVAVELIFGIRFCSVVIKVQVPKYYIPYNN